MLRICAVTHQQEYLTDLLLSDLQDQRIFWYWVDFDSPTPEESSLLDTYFHFHPLAVEDCCHRLQRPKMDHYGDTQFLVMHALHPHSLNAQEVNMFISASGIVTYHTVPLAEMDEAWKRVGERGNWSKGSLYAAYSVLDKLVDQYFPAVYELEDQLLEMESVPSQKSVQSLITEVFEIRSRLLRLRKTILPMRELLYRVVNSAKIPGIQEQLYYFTDVHDHLLKLSEMVDANREMTADLRDSYISMNADRMNTIMKTLTVITTIFMPLTFIAGIYGMNFEHMPELEWQGGYYTVLAVMLLIGVGMYLGFRRKGWFK